MMISIDAAKVQQDTLDLQLDLQIGDMEIPFAVMQVKPSIYIFTAKFTH
jgi:hypothetical protein